MSKENLAKNLSDFINGSRESLAALPNGDLPRAHKAQHEIVHLALDISKALRNPRREHLLGAFSRRALHRLVNLMADELCEVAHRVKTVHPSAAVPSDIELILLATDVVKSGNTDPRTKAAIEALSPTTALYLHLAGLAREALVL